ncbi:MAG: hypothetical protein LBI56_01965 [Puniceicoccales bacterium]|jgi:hypothetical protein|nr:hypothetical protein [Puniceicoccales bacterium]
MTVRFSGGQNSKIPGGNHGGYRIHRKIKNPAKVNFCEDSRKLSGEIDSRGKVITYWKGKNNKIRRKINKPAEVKFREDSRKLSEESESRSKIVTHSKDKNSSGEDKESTVKSLHFTEPPIGAIIVTRRANLRRRMRPEGGNQQTPSLSKNFFKTMFSFFKKCVINLFGVRSVIGRMISAMGSDEREISGRGHQH